MRFDVFRAQGLGWPDFLADVLALEEAGAGTVWVADHYGWPPRPEWELLEAWTTLAGVAAATKRIRLATAVTDASLRHPALLAKQVATVDAISGGRAELAIGAGFWEEELGWLGIPFLDGAGRAQRLREAVEIVDGLLREPPLTYEGEHWQVRDAPLVPRPLQQPRPPLLVAANGRKGLRLAAERGDGALSLGDPGAGEEEAAAALRERNAFLDECCAELGRDPATLERAYYVGWAEERPFRSVGALRDFIGRYRDAGAERLLFVFAASDGDGANLTRQSLEIFAPEILSA